MDAILSGSPHNVGLHAVVEKAASLGVSVTFDLETDANGNFVAIRILLGTSAGLSQPDYRALNRCYKRAVRRAGGTCKAMPRSKYTPPAELTAMADRAHAAKGRN